MPLENTIESRQEVEGLLNCTAAVAPQCFKTLFLRSHHRYHCPFLFIYLADLRAVIQLSRSRTNKNEIGRGTFAQGRYRREASIPTIKRTTVAGGTELRILPLGDSITDGFQSTDRNGYRLPLLNDLAGSKVLFIGSHRSGDMQNNQNEGHSGAVISEIQGHASLSLKDRPNVVLIHAGTNYMGSDALYSTAPGRYASLIDTVIDACPDATILVAQIVHSGFDKIDARIQTFNSQVPAIVADRTTKHKSIAVVYFSSVGPSNLQDRIHPNDGRYKKIGDIWFRAIQDAASKGWIKDPVGPDPTTTDSAGEECASGIFWFPAQNGAQIAAGVGHGGDGKFHAQWVPHNGPVAGGIGHNASGVRLADLDGDGFDDNLWVDPKSGALTAYLNVIGKNSANFVPVNGGKPIAAGAGPGAEVMFAALDNDKKAEYLYVDGNGAVKAYFNGSQKPDST